MEAHLALCPECRAVLAAYRRVGTELGPPEENLTAARERVWAKLAEAGVDSSGLYRAGRKRIWNRSVTLPLPAAAAAAALVIGVFLVLLGTGEKARPLPPEPVAAIGLDDRGIVPMQDMNGVINLLSSQDNGDFMIIRLPESRNFSRSGEPALINASDYPRRQGHR
jgi:hypothetical protein